MAQKNFLFPLPKSLLNDIDVYQNYLNSYYLLLPYSTDIPNYVTPASSLNQSEIRLFSCLNPIVSLPDLNPFGHPNFIISRSLALLPCWQSFTQRMAAVCASTAAPMAGSRAHSRNSEKVLLATRCNSYLK